MASVKSNNFGVANGLVPVIEKKLSHMLEDMEIEYDILIDCEWQFYSER